jgi:hypothetical protein
MKSYEGPPGRTISRKPKTLATHRNAIYIAIAINAPLQSLYQPRINKHHIGFSLWGPEAR